MIRNYSPEQSSAIASLQLEGQAVGVAFRSNPEKVYSFQASPGMAIALEALIVAGHEGGSLGRLIATARRCGDLQEVAV